jgi:argininosuccinate lyase
MLEETLDALAGAVETARFREDRMREALEGGEALATDAAELLVERGVPFREAHEAVGRAAAFASAAGRGLASLTVAEWRRFHRLFDRAVLRCFDPERSVARRDLPGGPAPRRVAAELRRWEKALGRKR